MYELLYEERWDEKKQKERRNEAAFFSPESPITREIPIEELFDVLDAGVWAYQTRYNSEALVHSFFEQQSVMRKLSQKFEWNFPSVTEVLFKKQLRWPISSEP